MKQRPRLAAALTRATREIDAAESQAEALEAIARAARESFPGIDHVGISLGRRDGTIETLAATDDLVIQLDSLQHELHEGPCVHVIEGDPIVRVERVPHDDRWPRFLQQAAQLGLKSQLAIRLHGDDQEMAALNAYSTSSETLDPDLEDIAELFASYASLTLGRVRREDQLNTALATRRVIGQAIGIVMERFGVEDDSAFRYLARLSNDGNIKLRDVAQRIVDQVNEQGVRGARGEASERQSGVPGTTSTPGEAP